MAVLAVLLAAALFVSSAAAATQGDKTVNITYLNGSVDTPIPTDGLTITTGGKVIFNVTQNASAGVVTVDWSKITLNYTTTEGYWDEGNTIKSSFTAASVAPFTFSEVGTYWIAAVNSTGKVFNSSIVKVIVEDEVVEEATTLGTFFVYETIYPANISGATTLYKLSGDATPAVLDTISVSATGTTLLKEMIGNNDGVWYTSATGGDYVAIWYPEIAFKAELTTPTSSNPDATSGDSIDGKTVNKDTNITFLIDAPKLGGQYINSAAAGNNISTVQIVFVTPAGGRTTQFGSYNFVDAKLGTARNVVNHTTQPGNDATAGQWVAQAEFQTFGGFSGFKDYGAKSNTITFTIQSSTLTITAAKDSVVRSNLFTVTIQGKSQTQYNVTIENLVKTDVNPSLQPNQNGFQQYIPGRKITLDTRPVQSSRPMQAENVPSSTTPQQRPKTRPTPSE
ncbi:MAG: hypothetical protein MJ014_01010 [Methanocorpusculum sp.]|nr:hypothetical protein [Methanocorpusculum sp.]